MGYNIEWASPEKTEVWSYDGRLYQSRKKAEIEKNMRQKSRDRWVEMHPDKDIPSWWEPLPPIYKIKWTWEEDNG